MIFSGLMLGGATVASAQTQAQTQPQTPPQTIPRADFLAQSKSQFAVADADHDGVITKAELRTAIATGGGGEPPAEMVDQVFTALDANRDGEATGAEVEAHDLALFDRWDTNHDGRLAREEMIAGSQAQGRAAPKP